MKIYRQTERFVVFGLIVAFMVFGIQTSAEAAGVGPEPVGSCGEFDAGAPWIADIEFSWTVENGGTAKVFAKVNYKGYKYTYEIQGLSTLDLFNENTTKESLNECLNSLESVAFRDEFGEPIENTLFAPLAIGSYKSDPKKNTVSARIIYGRALPETP